MIINSGSEFCCLSCLITSFVQSLCVFFVQLILKNNLRIRNPFLGMVGNLYDKVPALQNLAVLIMYHFSGELGMFQNKALRVMSRFSMSSLTIFVTVSKKLLKCLGLQWQS